MDKYIGRLLDNRYEILEVIGTGGMAVVYKARCHRLNRLVAIKILKDDFLEDEEFRRRFHSESQAVAMLSHPNIVSIYDVSSSITADYIVMELIDGITLKQYMEKKGVLNWKETLHFAIQIAKALEHAHSRGIVHRDIKPHNVMVLKNGSVKVTDFGIARMMSKGNTLTKEALGSVHYISPEQAKGGRVDSRSDIYSLGVVIYEMMSGRPPYDGESPVAIAIKHINGGAIMPSTLNPNIPGGLEQIIMKAMAHEPEQRYSSATLMLKDLDEFRKSPAMLFDYNTPPTDEVTRLHRAPVVDQAPPVRTTAERVEQRQTGDKTVPERRRTSSEGRVNRQSGSKKNAQNNTATIAIIACSLVMVVAIVVFLVVLLNGSGRKPELVQVPDLRGEMYEELVLSDDYKVKKDQEVHDNEYPAGQIISQQPNSGEEMVKGETIYVIVSLGKAQEIVYMPNVTDWELSQAEKSLNALSLNLQLDVEEEYNDKIPKGSIIRTEPAAETELTVGQEIKLVVSLGVEIKSGNMPNVIGDTLENSKKTLASQELDLVVEAKDEFSSTVPEGEVIRTDPEPGVELKTGQTVTVYYSKGPELGTMPNVTGFDIDKAVNVLISSGFKNYQIEPVESDEDKDTVIKQSVEKNTEVDVNTQIILEVSKGPADKPAVTKDVVINLWGCAAEIECQVTVKLSEQVVFSEKVPAGTESITLKDQSGTGTVYYEVMIGEEGWIEKVSFDDAQ